MNDRIWERPDHRIGPGVLGMRPFLIWISLRSKGFRLVSEQRKTEERDSQFWSREKWNKAKKCNFSRGLWLSFLVLKPHGKRLLRRLIIIGPFEHYFCIKFPIASRIETTFRFFIKGLFTRREGYPCAKGTLESRLKLALVYKQISQVGLPYHSGQLNQLCWRVSSCVTFFVTVRKFEIILKFSMENTFWILKKGKTLSSRVDRK